MQPGAAKQTFLVPVSNGMGHRQDMDGVRLDGDDSRYPIGDGVGPCERVCDIQTSREREELIYF